MTNLTYPDGRQVSQSWDAAGRLSSVYAPNNGQPSNYWTANSYFADGSPHSVLYGNGVNEQRSENSRLQTCEMSTFMPAAVGGAMVMDHQYLFGQTATTACAPTTGNNGNIWKIVDNTNPTLGSNARNQNFGYDALNRLSSWSTQSMAGLPRSQTYSYDSFGNMSQTNGVNLPNFSPGYDAFNHVQTFNCAPTNATGINSANIGYDLAGNVLCQGSQGIDAQAYIYDAESRVSQVQSQSMNNTYALAAAYTYDAEGNRVRKDLQPFGNQAYTEYVNFGNQLIAEKDQNGSWTDYIYAGGQKIAANRPLQSIAMHGANGSPAEVVVDLAIPRQIPIGAGDKLNWDQYQQASGGTVGGMNLTFENGWQLNGSCSSCGGQPSAAVDQNGVATDQWNGNFAWEFRSVDLSAFAGHTVTGAQMLKDISAPGGSWDLLFSFISITHADGTVDTIFNSVNEIGAYMEPNSAICCNWISYGGGVYGPTTEYYAGDHLGTTQIEFSPGGWPLWEGNFAPFGQEILPGTPTDFVGPTPSDGTAMHYKFTGKERDAESGLDYFGARYYGSGMGRWTSPDPSGLALADLGNPQSLNLYSYVINNPMILVDPDGLCYNQTQSSVWSCIGAFFHNLFGGGSDSSSSSSSSGSSSSTSSSQESVTVTMHWSTQLMQPGINYGNPYGPKGNNVGGCPLGTCHNFDGMYPPLTRGTFDGGMFMMSVLDGGFGASPSMFGKSASGSTYEEGVAAAQARYPAKAGRIEMHHIAPKYLGGDPLGLTVPLDGAYHQMITNEFRDAVPYGTGPIPPEELQQLRKLCAGL